MKWMPTCKEATELASRAMDERLPFAGRLGMRLHLALCANCRRFALQLQAMRRLLQDEIAADGDAPGLGPDARRRIETELQKKLGS